ncbi:MAG TPA: sigma-54 dependent transcriptional regulator [Bryobacteraceae bacterium]|jgi:DNA-binding NtrC family response regulator
MYEDDSPIKILAVDDDRVTLAIFKSTLSGLGLQIFTASNAESALEIVRAEHPQILLLDLVLPGVVGFELLDRILAIDPSTDIVLTTAHYSTESAVEAIQRGASDYLNKPIAVDRLQQRVGNLVADWKRRSRAQRLDEQLLDAYRFEGIIGRSPLMLEVFAKMRRVGPHFHTVLLTGQTGTGKELAAHALHGLSPHSGGPFIVCNCAAIPENLMESELFGHVRGSFTGAHQDKIGVFEAAHNGTLFLDEIGELPLAAQAKLLRAIQHQEIHRVGSPSGKKISVKIIAATNVDLRMSVEQRRFREDLFFRLSMVELHLPPLADRRDDLPLLMSFFVKMYSTRYKKHVRGFSRRAEGVLARYGWPGNVRELENLVGYSCMMADGDLIEVEHLPDRVKNAARIDSDGDTPLVTLDVMQRVHARRVLAATKGNKVKAAEILGISRATLYRLIADQDESTPVD